MLVGGQYDCFVQDIIILHGDTIMDEPEYLYERISTVKLVFGVL